MLIDRMDVQPILIRTTTLPLDNVTVRTVHPSNQACSWATKTPVVQITIIEISELHTCRSIRNVLLHSPLALPLPTPLNSLD